MNELRQCEEAFLNPDWPREYRVPEMSEEVYEDLRLTREMEMANIEDGGPAFPSFGGLQADCFGAAANTGYEVTDYVGGMSLLDYFAGQALVGILSVHDIDLTRTSDDGFATDAYSLAVAMLAERKRRTGGQC